MAALASAETQLLESNDNAVISTEIELMRSI
jgi:hypothetical protein